MAVSQGVGFSSQAAIWNPIGAIADLVYMALFAVGVNLPGYLGGNKNARTRKIKEVFFGLLLGFTGYILFILISGQFTVLSG
ncbi:MAG TPA: hypothetical protein VJJ51_13175, partial [Candidatus Methanoperedens sp.]|nr:hypothetical protein [Candidatus Methanoperedens sp.]